MTSLFVVLSLYILLGAVAAALYAAFSTRQHTLKDKLDDLAVKARVSQGFFETGRGELDGFGGMLLRWAARRLPAPKIDSPRSERLVETLTQAGYSGASAVRVFQLARFCLSAAGVVIALATALAAGATGGSTIISLAAGAAVGAFLPTYYVGHRAHARQDEIARQLSDVLDLLVVCVEAGLGLHESIKIVGNEVDRQGQVIGHELARVSGEMAAGKSLGQALRAFADRTAVEDIKPLAATLIQSEQLGAQIAPALRASSDSLRSKRRLRAEEEAHKTTVKILFPLVLFVLPAMLLVIVGPAIVQILHTFNN
jgi:tight adherence protein C